MRLYVWVFQHTAARRRLAKRQGKSTAVVSFNTQPPEGGWLRSCRDSNISACFNTQPPEGGWKLFRIIKWIFKVSTHSRPKAAGKHWSINGHFKRFQHTAARRRLDGLTQQNVADITVSTHSRPKAAGGASREYAEG